MCRGQLVSWSGQRLLSSGRHTECACDVLAVYTASMPRRPFLLLSLVLLAVAAVQAAATSLTEDASASNGIICTACGPIR
jgi:hypothetical protein